MPKINALTQQPLFKIREVTIQNDWSALHRAVARGQLREIERLCQYPIEITSRDQTGKSPLHIAAMTNNISAARVLLKNHVSANDTDNNGISPLHIAVENESLFMAKLLINHDANIHLEDDNGISPFKLTTIKNLPIMKIMLAESSSIFGDSFGDTESNPFLKMEQNF